MPINSSTTDHTLEGTAETSSPRISALDRTPQIPDAKLVKHLAADVDAELESSHARSDTTNLWDPDIHQALESDISPQPATDDVRNQSKEEARRLDAREQAVTATESVLAEGMRRLRMDEEKVRKAAKKVKHDAKVLKAKETLVDKRLQRYEADGRKLAMSEQEREVLGDRFAEQMERSLEQARKTIGDVEQEG